MPRPAKVKPAGAAAESEEREVLMFYQKTRNCRERKKLEVKKEKKQEANRWNYLKKSKDKVKCLEGIIKKSEDKIKQQRAEIQSKLAQIANEERVIAESKLEVVKKSEKKLKKKQKMQKKSE